MSTIFFCQQYFFAIINKWLIFVAPLIMPKLILIKEITGNRLFLRAFAWIRCLFAERESDTIRRVIVLLRAIPECHTTFLFFCSKCQDKNFARTRNATYSSLVLLNNIFLHKTCLCVRFAGYICTAFPVVNYFRSVY